MTGKIKLHQTRGETMRIKAIDQAAVRR